MDKYHETWKHLSGTKKYNVTFGKITKRLVWSIFMAGMGYALAYHHWVSWASEMGR